MLSNATVATTKALLPLCLALLALFPHVTVNAQTAICDVNALGLPDGFVQLYLCADVADSTKARIIYCGSYTELDRNTGPGTGVWSSTSGDLDGGNFNQEVLAKTAENILTYTPAGNGNAVRKYTQSVSNTNDQRPRLIGASNPLDVLVTANFASGVDSGFGPAVGFFTGTTAATEVTIFVPADASCAHGVPSAANPCFVQGNYLLTNPINTLNLDLPWDGVTVSWAPSTPGDRNTDTNRLQVLAPSTNGVLNSCASLCLVGGACGDPHFLRWTQKHRDSFHGECDMVLVSSQRGIDIQLRTKIRKFYSYIQKMAIRVGGRILEIDQTHLNFGNVSVAHEDPAISFPLFVHDTSYGNNENLKISRIGDKHYKIEWGTISWFSVSITGIFLNIYVGGGPEFADSIGLMGKFGTGEMLDRQGMPMDPKDMNAYGMEWQVKHEEGDPMLFSKPEGPQWPASQCVMPNWIDPKKKRRMLRGNDELYSAAKLACSGSSDVDMCVEDILVSGEMAAAEAFTIPNF